MNLAALHEAADALAQACLAVENRHPRTAGTCLLDALVAAAEAFPPESERSRALLSLIGAVECEARETGLLEGVPA